jgi:hypothetical protein
MAAEIVPEIAARKAATDRIMVTARPPDREAFIDKAFTSH